MGQGVHTVALQVAAEELGIDPGADRRHRRHHPRARLRPDHRVARHADGGRFGAAGVRRRAGRRSARPTSTTTASTSSTGRRSSAIPSIPNPTIHSCFSYAAQMVVIDRTRARSRRSSPCTTSARRSTRCWCEGQIEGSVHMGLGYALTEDFPTDPETGFPTNMTLRSLGILRAKDVPQIDVRSSRCPSRARPTASRASARSASSHRPGRRRRPARPRRRVAHRLPMRPSGE